MTRSKTLAVLLAMTAGCSLFPDPESQTPTPSAPGPTPQPNPCSYAELNGSNDGGVSSACACYQESASLPCYERNSCGDVVGNGYCTDNTVCIMAPPFGRLTAYYCECLLSCDGKACGEDNGCGNKCDAPCANGFECVWDTVGAKGCHDLNKCKGKPCGFVDDDGYACDGTCLAGTHCESGGDLFIQDQKETKTYSCVCTPNCGNKSCGASDGCGGTCDDACPFAPNPCDDVVGAMNLTTPPTVGMPVSGTAYSTYGSNIVCAIGDTYGNELDITVKPKTETPVDLSWADPRGQLEWMCFPANEAAICLPVFKN